MMLTLGEQPSLVDRDDSELEEREEEWFDLVVTAEDAGQRIDRFLATQEPLSLSRSLLQRLIESGQVWLGGRPVKPSARVREGDCIQIAIPAPVPLALVPEAIPLDILFEDEHLLVVNKPVGMVVHPAPGHDSGTLVHALLHHCRDLSGVGGVLRPGIVHRLDRDTSGVMVVAKHDAAHHGLATLFKERPKEQLDRRYVAVACGVIREAHGIMDTMYGRHPVDRKKFSSQVHSERRAITEFWVRATYTVATLLELKLHTGRTHQIRVHWADRGHPLLGDTVYGGRPPSRWPNALKTFPRQALHASKLAFVHPITRAWICCESSPPDDFQTLLETLSQLLSLPGF